MKNDIQIGDKIKWKGSTGKVYTVIGIGSNETYLVTNPEMLFPKTGMWINLDEIIQLIQERDIK
jgi:hypothetical protein